MIFVGGVVVVDDVEYDCVFEFVEFFVGVDYFVDFVVVVFEEVGEVFGLVCEQCLVFGWLVVYDEICLGCLVNCVFFGMIFICSWLVCICLWYVF